MPDPEHTLPFAEMVQDTAPVVPRVDLRLEWVYAEGEVHDLFARDLAVLGYICLRAGGTTGVCYAKRRTIAAACTRKSIDSLKKILIRLARLDLVKPSRARPHAEYTYTPTCVSSADRAPHECRPGTLRVPTGHPTSADRALALPINETPNSTSKQDLVTSPRQRAREREVSPQEKEYLRILELYRGTHTWDSERAGATIYAGDVERYNRDRQRWDMELAKGGRCVYCGDTEFSSKDDSSRWGTCRECGHFVPLQTHQTPVTTRNY